MNTYQIVFKSEDGTYNTAKKYIKTNATPDDVYEAIEFIKRGEVNVDRLLQALRLLGFKASELKIEPDKVFTV